LCLLRLRAAAGLGFALMQNVIMYGAVIGSAGHESIVYLDTCTTVPLPVLDCAFPVTAWAALPTRIASKTLLLCCVCCTLSVVGAAVVPESRVVDGFGSVPVIHMIISQLVWAPFPSALPTMPASVSS
jgi:hypothetical protein